LGNNSCGAHSVLAGRTSDNVHALDVLTYRGERLRAGTVSRELLANSGASSIVRRVDALRAKYEGEILARYRNIRRLVSAYNFPDVVPDGGFHLGRALVGSEGTCVAILEAELELVHSPPSRELVLLGYDDIAAAAADVDRILEFKPIALEGIDARFLQSLSKK